MRPFEEPPEADLKPCQAKEQTVQDIWGKVAGKQWAKSEVEQPSKQTGVEKIRKKLMGKVVRKQVESSSVWNLWDSE